MYVQHATCTMCKHTLSDYKQTQIPWYAQRKRHNFNFTYSRPVMQDLKMGSLVHESKIQETNMCNCSLHKATPLECEVLLPSWGRSQTLSGGYTHSYPTQLLKNGTHYNHKNHIHHGKFKRAVIIHRLSNFKLRRNKSDRMPFKTVQDESRIYTYPQWFFLTELG